MMRSTARAVLLLFGLGLVQAPSVWADPPAQPEAASPANAPSEAAPISAPPAQPPAAQPAAPSPAAPPATEPAPAKPAEAAKNDAGKTDAEKKAGEKKKTDDGKLLDLPFLGDAGKRHADDRFELDYAPTGEPVVAESGATPWYKHWAFWTAIGLAAAVGVVVGVRYGVDRSDSLQLEVTRRNP